MHPAETPELAAVPAPEQDEQIDPATAFAARAAGGDLVTLAFSPDEEGKAPGSVRRPAIALDLVPITDVSQDPRPETVVLTIPQAYGVVAGLVDALTIMEEAGETGALRTPSEVPTSADKTEEV